VVVVFVQVKNAQDLEVGIMEWTYCSVFNILSRQDCLVYFEWIYVFTSFIDRYMITDILG
jgi:hypothetical protein